MAADWYCTDVASEKKGSAIWVCGIGQGQNEDVARTEAFNNARKEYMNICSISSDCQGRSVTVNPMRTSCEVNDGQVTCHRLIVFEITASKGSIEAVQDRPMVFKPFEYKQIEQFPKIKEGMKKSDVLKYFGEPMSVKQSYLLSTPVIDTIIISYSCKKVNFCAIYRDFAIVIINQKTDKVVSFSGFDYKYTELLK